MPRSASGTTPGVADATVPVLHKALRVVGVVARGGGGRSLARIAADAGVATTTCYRILNTLRADGWVAQGVGGGWRLSAGLLPLLAGLSPYRSLASRLELPLTALAARRGVTAKVAVLEGFEAVGLLKAAPPDAVAVGSPTNASFHAALGATGAALLAAWGGDVDAAVASAPVSVWQRQTPDDLASRLAFCRENGWCWDVGGYHARVAAVARPFACDGVVACVALVGFPDDIARDEGRAYAADLRTFCRENGLDGGAS